MGVVMDQAASGIYNDSNFSKRIKGAATTMIWDDTTSFCGWVCTAVGNGAKGGTIEVLDGTNSVFGPIPLVSGQIVDDVKFQVEDSLVVKTTGAATDITIMYCPLG